MDDTAPNVANVNEMNAVHAESVELMNKIEALETPENRHKCDVARELSQSIFELYVWFEHYRMQPGDVYMAQEYLADLRERYADML